jgi:hypothetical protein
MNKLERIIIRACIAIILAGSLYIAIHVLLAIKRLLP